MSTTLAIEQHLRVLEEQLLQSDVRKSAATLDALLDDDFVEFGSSGRVFDKQQIIEGLPSEPAARRSLRDFKALALAPGVVLVTYRVIGERGSGQPDVHSLRSSVWRLVDGRWRMRFHQGTSTPQT